MSNNIITIAGENSKSKKKGGGFNAVLTLLKELSDFQDKVQTCIDAQDISDSKQKLEVFDNKLDEMAQVLLGMAEDGVRTKRKLDGVEEGVEEGGIEEGAEESEEESSGVSLADLLSGDSEGKEPSSVGKIQMMNVPTIPRFR